MGYTRTKGGAAMDQCTCYNASVCQRIQPLAERISEAQMENIKKNFASVKPMNDEPIAVKKNPSTAGTEAAAPSDRKAAISVLRHVTPYYTGYARIDNAITDALYGKSQELKDNVYDIMWNDLLRHNVHGLTEDDRTALISLGVQKAEYLADQFMDDRTKSSFMEAIRSVARIGMEGRRVSACKMEYNVKHAVCLDGNNHVHDDNMEEYLYTMEREAPEEYKTYLKLKKTPKTGAQEAAFFALRWAMKNLNLIAANRPDYQKRRDEQYEKLQKVKLDDTFSGADTSSKENFLASIVEKLKMHQNLQQSFFMEQIMKMSKTSGVYLLGRQMVLSGKA